MRFNYIIIAHNLIHRQIILRTDLSIANAIDRVDSPASDMPIMRFLISTLVSSVPFALPPFFVFFCRSVSDLPFPPLLLDDFLLRCASKDDLLFSLELHDEFELSDPTFTLVSGLGMLDCKCGDCCCT